MLGRFMLCLLLAAPFSAANDPVTCRTTLNELSDSVFAVSFDLKIQPGWHVYSTGLPAGGPVSASITVESEDCAVLLDNLEYEGDEIEKEDPVSGINVRFFEQRVKFVQRFAISDENWKISGYLTFAACDDQSCIPPQNIDFSYSGKPSAQSVAAAAGPSADVDGFEAIPGYDARQWAPADYDRSNTSGQGRGLWGLFLTSFLGGLLALLTPCVWPVIPMTVSFFLKRSENRKSAVRDAVIYGVSIVAVYVSLALLITLIFGASALNSLSTNAIVNLIFFAVLVAFALSFFGLFEITLPSGWSTGLSRKSSASGGVVSIFLMALTLSVVSFSCTGPIIGFLLVDAASAGGIVAPVIGMTGFSLALAIPFALFAMFPHWLKSMPKSGSWMEKIKVTLGFIELAFALKFLSVADMAYGWGILPRGLFVLLWILMAVFLGLYLLGVIRFHRDEPRQRLSWLSVIAAVIAFLFAAWMVPGLWGAPLKAISAFTPPMSTQHLKLVDIQVEPDCMDYAEALEMSAATGKPVLLDFTGYGCVNCRKMEASVWTDPEIASTIQENFILVSLFVDDKTPLDRTISVNENGIQVKLRTVGDKWSLLQRHKFGANAQPFYVIVNADGDLLSGPYTFDTEVAHFAAFLTFR